MDPVPLLREAGALDAREAGRALGCVQAGSGELQLFVQTTAGDVLPVTLPLDATLKDLKEATEQLGFVRFSLLFQGTPLQDIDDSQQLADLGFSNEAMLHMLEHDQRWVVHHKDITLSESGLRATRHAEDSKNCIAHGPPITGKCSFSLKLDNYAGLVGLVSSEDLGLHEHMGTCAGESRSWVLQIYAENCVPQSPSEMRQSVSGRTSFEPNWDPETDILHFTVDVDANTALFELSRNGGSRTKICEMTWAIKKPVCAAIGLYRQGSWAEFVR
eukprot:TRINITY_DN5587_c0_g1_i1.p1 TRINITY_DN5587_c0_g1~~TRINITY_DN5587_c0_g1_i1.p1  ORF type:complete len:273 (+),score=81.81 TRINITY_DN5587_c0_g1_i1:58-876(+)